MLENRLEKPILVAVPKRALIEFDISFRLRVGHLDKKLKLKRFQFSKPKEQTKAVLIPKGINNTPRIVQHQQVEAWRIIHV